MRFVTIFQILWFSLNCLGRALQNLSVTTLELTTLGFILCTLGTSYFWIDKPMDVLRPIILRPNISIATILVNAGESAREPYKTTPLDNFVGHDRWSWCLYWGYWMNILGKLGIRFSARKRPVDKVPDDNFPPPSRGAMLTLFSFTRHTAPFSCADGILFFRLSSSKFCGEAQSSQ